MAVWSNWTDFVRAASRVVAIQPKNSTRRRAVASGASIPAVVQSLESRKLLTVTYQGGALLKHVEVQGVYFGSDWANNTTLKSSATKLDQFDSMIVSGGYMDMLTNAGYNVGRGTSTTGVIGNYTLNKTSGVTDAQIRGDLQAMITAGKLATPDANRLYVVYVEPGVVIHDGTDSSATTFLGYHGAFAGKTAAGVAVDIRYAIIAYPGGPNPTSSSQGFPSDFGDLTAVASHEIGEAVTDPDVNYKLLGWYDNDNNGEIGDLTDQTTTLNGFLVQDLVDRNDHVINPNSIPAPQNVKLTALSATSAKLTWNSVAGTNGYRVYRVNGTTHTLVATLSATATSDTITGLTSGSKVSFLVESYTATLTRDSATVSVTLPKAAAVVLAAKASSTPSSSSNTWIFTSSERKLLEFP